MYWMKNSYTGTDTDILLKLLSLPRNIDMEDSVFSLDIVPGHHFSSRFFFPNVIRKLHKICEKVLASYGQSTSNQLFGTRSNSKKVSELDQYRIFAEYSFRCMQNHLSQIVFFLGSTPQLQNDGYRKKFLISNVPHLTQTAHKK